MTSEYRRNKLKDNVGMHVRCAFHFAKSGDRQRALHHWDRAIKLGYHAKSGACKGFGMALRQGIYDNTGADPGFIQIDRICRTEDEM